MSDDEKMAARKIKTGQGNYSEKISGDYIQEPVINHYHYSDSEKPDLDSNKEEKTQFLELTVSGEFELTNLADIVKIQQEILSNPNLTNIKINIAQVDKGSIKITFEGSEEDLKRLKDLIESGEITEVSNRTIQKVRLIDSEIEEKEIRTKVKTRNDLVQEIRSQKIDRRNLAGANLKFSDLNNVYLSEANLSDADLRGANLFHTNLRGANLSVANLSVANLFSADLSGANLRSAHLSGTNLRSANLSGTNLFSAYLIGANLRDTDLRSAHLRSANLRDADLRSADLSGADLRDAAVTNTRFINSSGISESIKQDLIQRGAIFEDSPGDRSRVLSRN